MYMKGTGNGDNTGFIIMRMVIAVMVVLAQCSDAYGTIEGGIMYWTK